ncbi:hypothetical protein MJO28_009366 [Puccinia striiformis f. sp. tritici]|uniref:Uncharacterized protein n=1 Tax=Puccinia striiformis f. sp. tritici TaxID=168172 RepID=A0ACC0E7M6_9BASI|nr:hypothetical protein MJO28_009366 [Puccinia striiformis f. sp. tritici]
MHSDLPEKGGLGDAIEQPIGHKQSMNPVTATASTRTLERLLIVLERSRDHSRCPSRSVMTRLSRKPI